MRAWISGCRADGVGTSCARAGRPDGPQRRDAVGAGGDEDLDLSAADIRSPDFGALGHVDGDGIHIYRRPSRRHAPDTEFEVAGLAGLPRVDIAYSYAGSDGAVVDASLPQVRAASSLRGWRRASDPLERAALERARDAGVAVVQSSRAGSGRVALRRYLEEAGMIAADNLNPQKAQIR